MTEELQREFKFRAWHPETGMAYLSTQPEELYPLLFCTLEERGQWKLMQWTGLRDKEGRAIYEGDIVEAVSEGATGRFVVVWRQTAAPLFLLYPARQFARTWYLSGSQEADGHYYDRGAVVLGNIYENPELDPRKGE